MRGASRQRPEQPPLEGGADGQKDREVGDGGRTLGMQGDQGREDGRTDVGTSGGALGGVGPWKGVGMGGEVG